MIYLDSSATTKPKQEVIDAMMPYFTEKFYNPSSLYGGSSKVKKDIENARKIIGDFINAKSNEIYFTSGGSESNCWAIQGFVNYWNRKGVTPVIITSTIEHKSILDCVDNMNVDVHYIGVNKFGVVDYDALDNVLDFVSKDGNKVLVSIQWVNNEIGTFQIIKSIAKLAHEYGAVFHTDAVQAFGKLPIDVEEFDIDILSASGHKIGCPKGIGILYKKNGINIDPLIYGSQMDGLRGGTENVAYIMGMAKAVEIMGKIDYSSLDYIDELAEKLMMSLKELGCKFNGGYINAVPNIISVTFPQNITGEALLYMLDMCGIMVATGSACNSHSNEPSHVLKAIGLTDEEAARTIRISLSDDIDYDKDIDKVIHEINKQIKLLTTEE